MRKVRLVGLIAVAATFLFAGCSSSVEVGPVPTITPKPTVTPAPTPTPVVVVEDTKEEVKQETVYDTKKYKEYYEKENKLPQLSVAYADLFTVGLETLQIDITDPKRQAVVKEQFNSISVKRDLSANYLMSYNETVVLGDPTHIALDFTGADVILKFAYENKIPVRGPRLISNEVPAWAFTKDLSSSQAVVTTAEDGTETTTIEYASPEVIEARMENYIKDIMTYCNTNYPGLIVSWDVLDDVLMANDGSPDLLYRTSSYWYQGMGEDYIVKACEYARKYAAKTQKLIYTQDALDEAATQKAAIALIEKLKAGNLIDGVGIQTHYSPNGPNVFAVDTMFKELAETGLELHITEFNVNSTDSIVGDQDRTIEELLARSAKRYKNLMTQYINTETKKGYDIVSVTFEGLTDDTSYLNEPSYYVDIVSGERLYGVQKENYPYLFDKDLNVKDSFFAAIGDVSIKGY